MLIVGIDAATKAPKVGVSWGRWSRDAGLVIEGADVLSRLGLPTLAATLRGGGSGVLVAMDAPLGWPAALGGDLVGHRAGFSLPHGPDQLFSRACDRMVWEQLRKKPLEVGANLIARTAHAALQLLQELRGSTGLELGLAWSPGLVPETPSVLEVYPAASRLVRGMSTREPYAELDLLRREGLTLSREVEATAHASGHVRDALACCLAAVDYLDDNVYRPGDPDLPLDCTPEAALKEGWIWIRRPARRSSSRA